MPFVAATVLDPDAAPHSYCLVIWTGKTGFVSVEAKTYCGEVTDAAKGVYQVPHQLINCARCKSAVEEKTGVAFATVCP